MGNYLQLSKTIFITWICLVLVFVITNQIFFKNPINPADKASLFNLYHLRGDLHNNSSNNNVDTKNNTLLILFTTFKLTGDRFYTQSQIILNWKQYAPFIQPVLFRNNQSDTLAEIAKASGWIVVGDMKVNKFGTPYLKPMFKYVMQHFKATFYGFANGDILFDRGLLDTLKGISTLKQPMLVTGQRWNYPFFKYMDNIKAIDPLWPSERVLELSTKSPKYRTDAEDYFITTGTYPWSKFKEVVIGRPGYDNYVVGTSIKLGLMTIDATKTVKAVHLTLNGSIYAGARNIDGQYNKKLIGGFNYNSGLTRSAPYATDYKTKTHDIVLTQRNKGNKSHT